MTPAKKEESGPKAPSQTSSAAAGTRKAWKPKSPVDVVLDQIHKQEKKVAELQQELDHEKVSLNKLLQAKKILES
jgi:hypothetical protein